MTAGHKQYVSGIEFRGSAGSIRNIQDAILDNMPAAWGQAKTYVDERHLSVHPNSSAYLTITADPDGRNRQLSIEALAITRLHVDGDGAGAGFANLAAFVGDAGYVPGDHQMSDVLVMRDHEDGPVSYTHLTLPTNSRV